MMWHEGDVSPQELISEMDRVLDELKKAQDAVHVELLATKAARRLSF